MKHQLSRREASSPGTAGAKRWVVLFLLLTLVGGGMFWGDGEEGRNSGSEEFGDVAKRARWREEARGVPVARGGAVEQAMGMGERVDVPVVEKLSQWPVKPGVEGRMDCLEHCAHCLAEKRLAICRAEYAELMYGQVVGERAVEEALEVKIREACQRMAGEALVDWSFGERRPLLVADPQLRELEDRYLGEYRSLFPES